MPLITLSKLIDIFRLTWMLLCVGFALVCLLQLNLERDGVAGQYSILLVGSLVGALVADRIGAVAKELIV